MLAWRTEGDAVVVLLRPDATVEGIAELKRVLNRPLVTRAVEADTFAAELSRVYNQGGAALAMSEGLANEADLARLMQDLPTSEDLLDGSAQAPVIRMINALLLQALRGNAKFACELGIEVTSLVDLRDECFPGGDRTLRGKPRALRFLRCLFECSRPLLH